MRYNNSKHHSQKEEFARENSEEKETLKVHFNVVFTYTKSGTHSLNFYLLPNAIYRNKSYQKNIKKMKL